MYSIIVESEILKMLTFNLVYALNNKLETHFLPQCLQYTLISLGPSFLFTSTLIKLSLVLSKSPFAIGLLIKHLVSNSGNASFITSL